MRKIKANISQKDRIISVNIPGGNKFYYQPAGSNERLFLFATNDFSGSVFTYFRDKGREIKGIGYSLTIKELYNFRSYHNPKLTRIINRIPTMIDYVISEQLEEEKNVSSDIVSLRKTICTPDSEEREYAA